MNVLVLGATGATGRLLTEQLLERDVAVRAIVRSVARVPDQLRSYTALTLTEAEILSLSDDQLTELARGVDGVASCLGHTLSFKGIYGKPRRLVTDATRRVCDAIAGTDPQKPVRFVLMNTTGNRNRDNKEPRSLGEHVVIGLLRLLLPPQPDNEQAAEHLRTGVGRDSQYIEWAAVRPDSLVDEAAVSPYDVVPSPLRSPIFNAGNTSRINVAHFMARLLLEDDLWSRWRFQMPVIYNATTPGETG